MQHWVNKHKTNVSLLKVFEAFGKNTGYDQRKKKEMKHCNIYMTFNKVQSERFFGSIIINKNI